MGLHPVPGAHEPFRRLRGRRRRPLQRRDRLSDFADEHLYEQPDRDDDEHEDQQRRRERCVRPPDARRETCVYRIHAHRQDRVLVFLGARLR